MSYSKKKGTETSYILITQTGKTMVFSAKACAELYLSIYSRTLVSESFAYEESTTFLVEESITFSA